jgi:hypothetical protein
LNKLWVFVMHKIDFIYCKNKVNTECILMVMKDSCCGSSGLWYNIIDVEIKNTILSKIICSIMLVSGKSVWGWFAIRDSFILALRNVIFSCNEICLYLDVLTASMKHQNRSELHIIVNIYVNSVLGNFVTVRVDYSTFLPASVNPVLCCVISASSFNPLTIVRHTIWTGTWNMQKNKRHSL